MALDSEALEKIAHASIEYISARIHEEKPHISVLGADRRTAERVFEKQTQPLYEPRASQEELIFYDEMDPYSGPRLVPNAYGCYAEFKPISEYRWVKFTFSFYIRVAPHRIKKQEIPEAEEFRRCVIEVFIINEQNAKLRININGAGEKLEEEYEAKLDFIKEGRVKELWFEIPVQTYSKLRSIPSKVISDDKVLKALATLKETSYGEFYFGSINKSSKEIQLVYTFAIRVGVELLNNSKMRIYCLLYNVGGFVINSEGKRIGSYHGYARYVLPGPPNQVEHQIDRWSVEYLLEISGMLEWNGYGKVWKWIHERSAPYYQIPGLRGLFPVNCLAIETEEGKVLLRDWHLEKEIVPKIKEYREKPAEDTIAIIASEFGLEEAGKIVAHAFRSAFPKARYLYSYQVKALKNALKIMKKDIGKGACLAITARTAGGKTLAFLLPILLHIVERKLRGGEKGVKAMLFYPTKALANDQAEVIVRFLWHIGQLLMKRGIEPVSIGILHGDTRSRNIREIGRIINEKGFGEEPLRIKCPLCGKRLIVRFEVVNEKWANERIRCESGCLDNVPERNFIEKILKVTRESIYSDPPDVLITNPDTINVRLLYEPASHSIFGRPVAVCTCCGTTYANLNKKKCIVCDSPVDKIRQSLSYPQIIVMDEAHLIRGVFGSQVSFVLTRMEQAIRTLNRLPKNWRPFYILSSATLNNAQNRAKELLGEYNMLGGFHVIEAEYTTQDEGEASHYTKLHLFIMPKAFAPQATLGRLIEKIIELYAREGKVYVGSLPSILIFANRIAEVNSIVHLLKDLLAYVEGLENRIDGHTTDFSRQRAEIEDAFSRGDIKILIATSGLEVGVDFDIVDVGCIYGMPYYMSDYVQRIGRCGRNKNALILNLFMPDKPTDHFFYRNWKLLCDLEIRDLQMRCETYTIRRANEEVVKRSACRAFFDFLSTRDDAYRYYEEVVIGALSSSKAFTNAQAFLKHVLDKLAYSSLLQQIQKLSSANLTREDSQQPEFGSVVLRSEMPGELKEYISNALLVDEETLYKACQEVKELINRIVLQEVLAYGKSGATLQNLIRNYNEIFLLWDIRTSELQCAYEFEDLEKLGLVSREESTRERDMSYAFRHCIPEQIISYRGYFFSVKKVDAKPWVDPSKDPERLIWGGNE